MALKTSLPSFRRLFVLFTILAFVLTFAILNPFVPQASEQGQVTSSGCAVDVAVVLDTSTAMDPPISFSGGLTASIDTINQMLNHFQFVNENLISIPDNPVGARVAFGPIPLSRTRRPTLFRGFGINPIPLTSNFQQIREVFPTLQSGGTADVAAGITQAYDQLKASRRGLNKDNRIILVISPAQKATNDQNAALNAANNAKGEVTLVGIQVGTDALRSTAVTDSMMPTLASEGQYYYAGNKAELVDLVVNRLARRVCQKPAGSVNCVSSELDVAYILDDSGTMDDNIIDRDSFVPQTRPDSQRPDRLMKNFMPKAQSKLKSGSDRAGIITFSDPVQVRQGFTQDLASVTASASAMNFNSGGSDLGAAIQSTSQYFQNSRRSNEGQPFPGVVIVLADTRDITISDAAIAIAEQDHQQRNIRYFTIDLGGNGSRLQRLAESGGGTSFVLTRPEQTDRVIDQLSFEIENAFSNCISIELESSKSFIRRNGGNVTLTYRFANNSRRDIPSATITQALPSGVTTNDKATSVSVSLGTLKASETGTRQVKIQTSK